MYYLRNILHWGLIVFGRLLYLVGWLGSRSPKMIPESPTCPMKSLPRLMKQTEAVVPAVDGKPEAVFFHEGKSFHISCCVDKNPSRMAFKTYKSYKWLNKLGKSRSNLYTTLGIWIANIWIANFYLFLIQIVIWILVCP